MTNPWSLNENQTRMLDLLVAGKCDKRIAREIEATPVAVRCAMSRIKEKMGADNRVQAAILWDRHTRADRVDA